MVDLRSVEELEIVLRFDSTRHRAQFLIHPVSYLKFGHGLTQTATILLRCE